MFLLIMLLGGVILGGWNSCCSRQDRRKVSDTIVIAVRGNLVSTAEVRGQKGTKAFFLFELP